MMYAGVYWSIDIAIMLRMAKRVSGSVMDSMQGLTPPVVSGPLKLPPLGG